MKNVADRIIELVDICCEGNRSEFARRIGLTPAYISKIDKERDRIPSERTIADICREFNVNKHWLETGEGEMFKSLEREAEIAMFFRSVGQPDGELDQFKQNLILALAKLDESEWEVIAGIAKKLAEASESNKKEG